MSGNDIDSYIILGIPTYDLLEYSDQDDGQRRYSA